MTRKQRSILVRIIVGVLCFSLAKIVPLPSIFTTVIYLVGYVIVGYDILYKALRNITRGRVFDENFLMAVATIGAIAIGDFAEACAVMIFDQLGELFESIAVGQSRREISALMDIRPDYANLLKGDTTERVSPDEVGIDDTIVVLAGEKIPLDGIVIEGSTSLNTSALTGESKPQDVKAGDEVLCGCINISGTIKIRVTKPFGESTASKILELLENSTIKKSKSETFINKFAKYYTPIVCISALSLAIIPPTIDLLFVNGVFSISEWLYRALTFLVISCPCALVISIPLGFFATIGGASKRGILIKGSEYIETLSQVTTIAMDKTGTLTEGTFSVTQIVSESMTRDEVLAFASAIESSSTHPIAKSIVSAYGKPVPKASNVQELAGRGLTGEVEGHLVHVGNVRLMESIGLTPPTVDTIATIVHVAVDESYIGYILISDTVKPTSRSAISSLKALGVRETVMLTGDNEAVASNVANEVGVDRYIAGLLPDGKVQAVQDLMESSTGKLAFVGDGINDAPVLALSDVGISMGAIGSDSAIEASDIVLMDDNPSRIAEAIRLSRKCMKVVRGNTWFSIGVKITCLLLSSVGIANMWMAIFADVGVMILAVLNSMRCLIK